MLTVITHEHLGAAVGFGLFAMLSVVRLRSEPFGNADLAYFFCALALALVNGLRLDDPALSVALDALILLTLFLVDHPTLYRRTARQRVTLDEVVTGEAALRAAIERRLGVEVVEVTVEETDFVREVTRVSVRYLQPAGSRSPSRRSRWRRDHPAVGARRARTHQPRRGGRRRSAPRARGPQAPRRGRVSR